MASRTFGEIDKAKQSLTQKDTDASIRSYPPGHFTGFQLSIESGGKIAVGPGSANVYGASVSISDTQYVKDEHWVVPRVFSFIYYVYIDRTNVLIVDAVKPTKTSYGWVHPARRSLHIGSIYYASSGRPIVSQRTTTRFLRAPLLVAPDSYQGEADLYYDGIADQNEINDAIDFARRNGGGSTEVVGSATITSAINLYADCDLVLRAGCVISKVGSFNGILAEGEFGSHISNIHLRGPGTILRGTGDDLSGLYSLVKFSFVDDSSINDITASAPDFSGIWVTECDRVDILRCNTTGAVSGYGILVASGVGGDCSVKDCVASGNAKVGIRISDSDRCTVQNNVCNDNTEAGINILAGQTPSDDCIVALNKCSDNTTNGIEIGSSCSRTLVVGNLCLDNGTDTGVANTNTDNFDDGGTDTLATGNSWQ